MADDYAREITKQAVARACVALGNTCPLNWPISCIYIWTLLAHASCVEKLLTTDKLFSLYWRLQRNTNFNPRLSCRSSASLHSVFISEYSGVLRDIWQGTSRNSRCDVYNRRFGMTSAFADTWRLSADYQIYDDSEIAIFDKLTSRSRSQIHGEVYGTLHSRTSRILLRNPMFAGLNHFHILCLIFQSAKREDTMSTSLAIESGALMFLAFYLLIHLYIHINALFKA